MHKGYWLRTDNEYLQEIACQYVGAEPSTDVPGSLRDYLVKGGIFDCSAVEDDFFPHDLHFDIFISHFHKDADIALAFAIYLEKEFGLSVFLDFKYWGCYTKLLEDIDRSLNAHENSRVYGFKSGELLDYEKCRFSASVMHMMLGVALARVIHATECVFFLNSGQYRLTDYFKEGNDKLELGSPWVYHELWMTKLLEDSGRTSPRVGLITEAKSKDFTPRLKAPIKQLEYLDTNNLKDWEKKWRIIRKAVAQEKLCSGNALDILYRIR